MLDNNIEVFKTWMYDLKFFDSVGTFDMQTHWKRKDLGLDISVTQGLNIPITGLASVVFRDSIANCL